MQQYPCSDMTCAQAAELFVACVPSSNDALGASLVGVLELIHDSEGAQASQMPCAVWYMSIFTALQSACGSTVLLQEVAKAIEHDETQVYDPLPTFSISFRSGCMPWLHLASKAHQQAANPNY